MAKILTDLATPACAREPRQKVRGVNGSNGISMIWGGKAQGSPEEDKQPPWCEVRERERGASFALCGSRFVLLWHVLFFRFGELS